MKEQEQEQEQRTGAGVPAPANCSCAFFLLSRYDRFDLAAFQERDDAVAAIPDSVSRSPNFVSIDLPAAGQHYHGFAALPLSHAWSTGRNRIGVARV